MIDEQNGTLGQRLLTPTQIALARSRTYMLLSNLYLKGVTSKNLPIVETIPDLSNALHKPFDQDEASATHQDVFGFNVFPYQGVFLDTSNLLGGGIETTNLIHTYSQAGYSHMDSADSPEHLGTELAFLAFLCGATADALEDGQVVISQRIEALQSDFLQQHLLRWLPALLLAVQQQGSVFYSALTKLTLAFVADHAADFKWDADFTLPKQPELLTDDKTGIKEIAALLLRPIHSGFYLSRRGIGQLARQHQLPRGFGDREQMLTNLLRSAIQYDRLKEVLSDLAEHVDGWHHAYALLITDHPALAPFAQAWQKQVIQTKQLLVEIQEMSQSDEHLLNQLEKTEYLQ